MTQPNYCHDIHHNLAIDYVNGRTEIGMCCQSGRIVTDKKTILEYWDNPTLKKLREDNLNGKLSSEFCNACINVELDGIKSRRQNQHDFYKDWNPQSKKIRGIDIKLGNLCNLKCTICGPDASTAWIADAKKLGKEISEFFYYDKELQFNLSDSSALHDLELLHFWGGEPLIDDKHTKVLEFLNNCGILENCRITYNTNGTYKVNARVLELWAKAKLVELYFSIDDINDRFEYERYGAKWNKLIENLLWYRDNLSENHLFYITCVVSYLNIWYLPELINWKKQNFDTNRLGDQTQLLFQVANGECAIDNISTKLKYQILEKFELYPEIHPFVLRPGEQLEYNPKTFIDYITKLDVIRNTSYNNTFTEFNRILNDSI